MNNISLIMYLADVAENMSVLSSISIFISFAILMVSGVVYITTYEGAHDINYYDYESQSIANNISRRAGRYSVISIIIFGLIATVLPSHNTIYTMGAVQAIEQLSTIPQAGVIGEMATDTLELLRNKIKEMKNAKE